MRITNSTHIDKKYIEKKRIHPGPHLSAHDTTPLSYISPDYSRLYNLLSCQKSSPWPQPLGNYFTPARHQFAAHYFCRGTGKLHCSDVESVAHPVGTVRSLPASRRVHPPHTARQSGSTSRPSRFRHSLRGGGRTGPEPAQSQWGGSYGPEPAPATDPQKSENGSTTPRERTQRGIEIQIERRSRTRFLWFHFQQLQLLPSRWPNKLDDGSAVAFPERWLACLSRVRRRPARNVETARVVLLSTIPGPGKHTGQKLAPGRPETGGRRVRLPRGQAGRVQTAQTSSL